MKHTSISRRDFLRNLGVAGAGVLLTASPWLSAFSEVAHRYIKAMEMIHAGTFGEINAIRTFWNRNGDWRRPVPSPGFLQMINDWENKVFDSLPFAGTSWAPETANENTGELILGERPKSDGTSLLLAAAHSLLWDKSITHTL